MSAFILHAAQQEFPADGLDPGSSATVACAVHASVPRSLKTKFAFDNPRAPDDSGDTSSPDAIHALFGAAPLATRADEPHDATSVDSHIGYTPLRYQSDTPSWCHVSAHTDCIPSRCQNCGHRLKWALHFYSIRFPLCLFLVMNCNLSMFLTAHMKAHYQPLPLCAAPSRAPTVSPPLVVYALRTHRCRLWHHQPTPRTGLLQRTGPLPAWSTPLPPLLMPSCPPQASTLPPTQRTPRPPPFSWWHSFNRPQLLNVNGHIATLFVGNVMG